MNGPMNGLTRRRALALGAGAWGAFALPLGAETAPHNAPSAVSLLRPAVPVRDARGLALRDAQKQTLRLGDLAGGRAVLLNLWAPWCLPCRREMPSLARLALALGGQGPLVLPLAFDWRGASGVRRFYAEAGIANLPIWLGEGENLSAVLGLEDLPTTAIIDRAGQMVQLIAGEARWDDAATLEWARGL